MENKTKHTPAPWKVKHSESKHAFNVIGTQLGQRHKIARCPYPVSIQKDVKQKLSDVACTVLYHEKQYKRRHSCL